jgi:MerR family copper efflux transcriptional regulator
MRIGQAAERAGVNIQTLRYYERRGLLPRHARRASGYRDIADDAVRVVRFIKRAQNLGFSLDEIEELLKLRKERARERRRIRAIAQARLTQVDQKIAELQAMREALAHLVYCCEHGGAVECPIIEALEPTEEIRA